MAIVLLELRGSLPWETLTQGEGEAILCPAEEEVMMSRDFRVGNLWSSDTAQSTTTKTRLSMDIGAGRYPGPLPRLAFSCGTASEAIRIRNGGNSTVLLLI